MTAAGVRGSAGVQAHEHLLVFAVVFLVGILVLTTAGAGRKWKEMSQQFIPFW